jgi:cytochrome c
MSKFIKPALFAGLAVTAGVMSLSLGSAAQSAAPTGEQLFRQRCAACHSVVAGKNGVGPSLTGVVGRKAASTKYAYSAALKKSNLTWTRASLDRYLSGPARMVPGTKMTYALSDQTQRTAVIQYLSQSR